MAFKNMTLLKRLSDLLIGHYVNNFNNESINITPLAGQAVLPLGSVVFRAKGAAPADPYAKVTADADVVDTNEFVVVLGDEYGFNYDFNPKAIKAGFWNAIGIKRGPVELKEFYIKEAQSALTAPKHELLKQLLADQGLVVLDDISKFTHTI